MGFDRIFMDIYGLLKDFYGGFLQGFVIIQFNSMAVAFDGISRISFDFSIDFYEFLWIFQGFLEDFVIIRFVNGIQWDFTGSLMDFYG